MDMRQTYIGAEDTEDGEGHSAAHGRHQHAVEEQGVLQPVAVSFVEVFQLHSAKKVNL